MNFRRRRPRKQPRSVLSSPERVFPELKDEPIPDPPPHTKKRKRPRRRLHGIEKWGGWPIRRWGGWKWYDSEKQRDQALADLLKHGRHRRATPDGDQAFRPVDRPQ